MSFADAKNHHKPKKKTTIGIIWNFTEQIARTGVGALITLLLSWFPAPADHGLS